MFKRLTLMACLLSVVSGHAFGAAPVESDADAEAHKILAESDAIRNPSRSFGLTTTMTE